MTRSQIESLKHLNTGNLKLWHLVDYDLARKFDKALDWIGSVIITSTWRDWPKGSMHTKGLALDFVPQTKLLWPIYLTLRALGWKRIGIRPDANMIHVDIGMEKGLKKYPYYFYEIVGGKDAGPLDKQPIERLRKIPGYTEEPLKIEPVVKTPEKKPLYVLPPKLIEAAAPKKAVPDWMILATVLILVPALVFSIMR